MCIINTSYLSSVFFSRLRQTILHQIKKIYPEHRNLLEMSQAQWNLLPAEVGLHQFFHLSPDILMIADYSGNIKRFNRSFYTLLGYEPNEMSFATVDAMASALLHPADMKSTYRNMRMLLHSNESLYFENRLRCKDNSYKWFGWSAIRDPISGLVFGVAHDITKEKHIAETQALLANIIQSSEDAIISFDADLRIRTWNQAAERLYGFTSAEAIGRHLTECCQRAGESEQQLWEKVMRGQVVKNWETVRRKKDGTLFHVSLTISPIRDEKGEISGYAAISRDITEHKKMLQELFRLERLNLIGQIAAGIAHEIRNPMTTIRGFLQLLAMKPKFQEDKEHFQLMIDELDRANSIISEFLSLARTNTSKPQRQSLNNILRSFYPLIQAEAIKEDKNVEMILEDLPDLLLDEKEIRQLVLNLCKNALEAMAPGKTLSIKTYMHKGLPVLAVKDQGSGIPPEIQAKLGLPFVTTKDTGTGLGLSLCYSIAARHNAELSFDTGPQGTTFYATFNLPPLQC